MNFYLHPSKDFWYIMKITLSQLMALMIFCCVTYAAPGKAQGVLNNPVKINYTSAKLKTVLSGIEKSAGVKFVYSENVIDADQEVSYSAESEMLSEVLADLLRSRGIGYQVVNNQIVLNKAADGVAAEVAELQSTSLSGSTAADITLTGKVTDDKGESLPGVSIKIKGTNLGVATSVNGTYSLRVPTANVNGTLVVSYMGFTTREVPINGQTTLNIVLSEDVKALDEVVVVGYNIVKKSDVTGSVVSVGAEEIRSRPVQNALQAVQGKAAGVDITSNERPGEMGKILIRGARSLKASNDPLYVVDGIPLSFGGIEAINPNDIESIDILKDASATAIYGSRGANGVVLVTTKKGKTGTVSLNYVGTSTIEKMYDRTDMMNSAEYIEFRRDAYRRLPVGNANKYPDVATEEADRRIFGGDTYALDNVLQGWQNGVWNGNLVPTTNWTDMMLETGLTVDQTLSASGGTETLKGYGSFGYLSQGGTQLGQDYERFSGKFSAEVKPTKWFTFGGNLTATYGIQNYGYATSNATGPGNLYFAAQGMLPYAVPFDDSGNRINLPGGDINILNPVGEDVFNVNERKTLRTLGSLFAEVDLFKGLKYRANFGPDFYNWRNGRWMDENSINRGAGEPGSSNYARLDQTSRLAWTMDNLLYYNKSVEKHNFGVTLLQSATSYREETSSMTATDLPWNSQKWYQLNSVSELDAFGSGLTESSLTSYMARVNYDFNSRYLLTASARWDGASQLAEGNKWDFFPSAALAWRMDQENFLKNTRWINMLKLRVGVGSTGNAAVGPYTTKGAVETLYYTWGGLVQPGYVSSDASLADPILMPNQDLGWEHTTQWNLGVDFDFFNGRVSGAIDVYTSRTTDLLMEMSIPSLTGYTRTLTNIGISANRGIDISLNTVNIKKRDFNWSSSLNFSANRDRIVELANGEQDDITNNWFIDERLTTYYDYEKLGIWQNTESDLAEIAKFQANGNTFRPGDIKIADLNGDYRINANDDRRIVGAANPDWTAGLTNTFNYKNWDLSFFMYARWGFTIRTGEESLQGRFAQRKVNYWTPSNPTNEYPAPNYNSAAGDAFKSSMNYQDGSFIKLRNVSLGYSLPEAWNKKLRLSNVKLYAQALNPGLIYSKIDWIDPDLGGSTFNRGFVFGINVGF